MAVENRILGARLPFKMGFSMIKWGPQGLAPEQVGNRRTIPTRWGELAAQRANLEETSASARRGAVRLAAQPPRSHRRMRQPDLNFAVTSPELFAGSEMGEDALRVLG